MVSEMAYLPSDGASYLPLEMHYMARGSMDPLVGSGSSLGTALIGHGDVGSEGS